MKTTRDILYPDAIFRAGSKVTRVKDTRVLKTHRFASFVLEDIEEGKLLAVQFEGEDRYRLIEPGDAV